MSSYLILMYHMVHKPQTRAEAKYACPPEQFDKHMRFIRNSDYTPISLDIITDHVQHQTPLPVKPVAITLDDGFEDNYIHAFPILKQYAIPATVFLTTGTVADKNRWMTGRGFPERSMLNWSQILEMSDFGIDIGAHTVSHPKLPELTAAEISREISGSKSTIEDKLGKNCTHFAYPYGLHSDQVRHMVAESGFSLACSTVSGFNRFGQDPYLLRRLEVFGNDPVWKLKQKMTFGFNNASLFFPLAYYSRRLANRIAQ